MKDRINMAWYMVQGTYAEILVSIFFSKFNNQKWTKLTQSHKICFILCTIWWPPLMNNKRAITQSVRKIDLTTVTTKALTRIIYIFLLTKLLAKNWVKWVSYISICHSEWELTFDHLISEYFIFSYLATLK